MKRYNLPLMALVLTAVPARAAGETDTWKELGMGLYSDTFMSNMYQSTFTNEPVDVLIEESVEHPGLYRITNPWPQVNHITHMIIDASDPELVLVPKQNCGIDDPQDGETWIASLSQIAIEDEGFTKETFLEGYDFYNITMQDGVIKFPAGSGMFMWPNPVSGYSEPGEWMVSNDEFPGYLCMPGVEPPQEWKSLGMGKMCDGFMGTFISGKAEPRLLDVEIMEHVEYEGYYRVVQPFADLGDDTTDLTLDLGKPDFGFMEVQRTGLTHGTMGDVWVLSMSANGMYYTLEDFIAAGHEAHNITMTDGRIDIPKGSVLFYFPQYTTGKLFDNQYATDSYILMPGTEAIDETPADFAAEPEYYNLQGRRVTRPEAGQLLIVRRGAKATKQIYR